jgi:hypothetical protein
MCQIYAADICRSGDVRGRGSLDDRRCLQAIRLTLSLERGANIFKLPSFRGARKREPGIQKQQCNKVLDSGFRLAAAPE